MEKIRYFILNAKWFVRYLTRERYLDLPPLIPYFAYSRVQNSAKNIAVLGSTGSIGRNSLEVIRSLPGQFKVTYLTANKNTELLAEQIRLFKPRGVVVSDEAKASVLRN